MPRNDAEAWFGDSRNLDTPENEKPRAHPFRIFDFETQRWNLATVLAIAAEPMAQERIHGKISQRMSLDRLARDAARSTESRQAVPAHLVFEKQFEWFLEDRAKLAAIVSEQLRIIGREVISREREKLSIRIHDLEPNTNIMRLCRLMTDSERRKLCGRLGYALLLHEMSETIRYAAEGAFQEEFPEEDLVYPMERAAISKVELCGSERMLDNIEACHQFVRRVGLDFGLRAACYVEGATEAGALRHLFPEGAAVSIVSLGGQGETPRLRELLLANQRDRIFTAMLLDGDREDRIREAKAVAQDRLLTLGFAVCNPDFEYGIEATDEDRFAAIQTLWAEQAPAIAFPDAIVRSILERAESGRQLENLLKNEARLPSLKGIRWGSLLCEKTRSHTLVHEGQSNPFWSLVYRVLQARSRNYLYETTAMSTEVDLKSGALRGRQSL